MEGSSVSDVIQVAMSASSHTWTCSQAQPTGTPFGHVQAGAGKGFQPCLGKGDLDRLMLPGQLPGPCAGSQSREAVQQPAAWEAGSLPAASACKRGHLGLRSSGLGRVRDVACHALPQLLLL